jgi:putative transcriptional regulator
VNSLRGNLLVSSPSLHDPNFRKTVVLVAHHDAEGAMGLVLSRPSTVSATDAVPALDGLPGSSDVVFVGGPVQPETFMVLAEFEDVEEAAASIFGTVGFMAAEADPEQLSIRRLRLFSGYAGWAPDQLEAELEEEAWIVEPVDPDDPFHEDDLWPVALRRKGGEYALLARMPVDPSLN